MILCPMVQRKVLKVLVVIMVMKMNTIVLFVIVRTKPCVVDDLPEGASPLGFFPEFTPAGDGVGKAHDLENVQEDSTLEHFRMFYPDIIFDKLLTAPNS